MRPRTVMLDWLLKTEEATVGYDELKMSAQERSAHINEEGKRTPR